MGQGGRLVLVNATNSVWKRTRVYAHQMEHWQHVFPYNIQPGEAKELYVEWEEGWSPFFKKENNRGEVRYELEETGESFEIQAVATDGFELQVVLEEIETNAKESDNGCVSLGWKHNGYISFVLAGEEKPYSTTGMDASKWMSEHLDVLGDKPIHEIAMPGSHNAGMSEIIAKTFFVGSANTKTQSQDLKGQLLSGTRYFDVRPVVSGGRFATGHYSRIAAGKIQKSDSTTNVIDTWQGATGQALQDIIENVNEFTEEHPELIVIMLSHCLNTDVGNSEYRPLNEEENERMLEELSGLNHLYCADPETNLTELTLNTFLEDGTAAVVVVLERGYSAPDSLQGQGFFENKCFPVYDEYSNSDELEVMVRDQLRKMEEFNSTPGRCFVLSWTLTLQGIENVAGGSVRELADEANGALALRGFGRISTSCFPNVVYLDYIDDSMAAVFCMAANWKVKLGL